MVLKNLSVMRNTPVKKKTKSRTKKKPGALKARVNAGIVRDALQQMLDKGILSPGDIIYIDRLEQVIIDNKLDRLWKRDPNAGDSHGLQRSLSDIVGGWALNLNKIGIKQYIMPKGLPLMDGDNVMTLPVY